MKHLFRIFLFVLFAISSCCMAQAQEDACRKNILFNAGTGIYDITGPAAEEGMMGYAMLHQQTAGILQRLWARAFVIASPCNGKRIAFVTTDLGMIFQGIKQQVVEKLQKKYGNLYTNDNVLLTATHTHSGPGGFSTYTLYNITTLGFNGDNFNTIVDGIVAAIDRAHHNLGPAVIRINRGELRGVSYNRSPGAFAMNPEAERLAFPFGYNPRMTLIRLDRLNGLSIGTVNWFPLHGVSMNNKNHLINGDNKGYAEYLFEREMGTDYGPDSFVAAFTQANAGDVSPNPYGQEGGTGLAGRKVTELAGKAQYDMAHRLFHSTSEFLTGGIDYRHTHVAMDHITVDAGHADGHPHTTCPAAIGLSMLAGCQDGEGLGEQGLTCDDVQKKLPDIVCKLKTTDCQGAKPIAIEMGTMTPYPWTPNILPLQLVTIGQLAIVAAPFELTTLSGERIRKTVEKHLPGSEVVISALSNAYAGYITTPEAYSLQRYEAASNHFGPWTLPALQQEYEKLADALANGNPVPPGPTPPDLSHNQTVLQPGVLIDTVPAGKQFGELFEDVQKNYHPGETVKAVFWTGHPKNNFRIQDTFLAVQLLKDDGRWITVSSDRDWDTEYAWQRHGLSASLATLTWYIPEDVRPGTYRIVHYGDWKSGPNGALTAFTGYSSSFTVTANQKA